MSVATLQSSSKLRQNALATSLSVLKAKSLSDSTSVLQSGAMPQMPQHVYANIAVEITYAISQSFGAPIYPYSIATVTVAPVISAKRYVTVSTSLTATYSAIAVVQMAATADVAADVEMTAETIEAHSVSAPIPVAVTYSCAVVQGKPIAVDVLSEISSSADVTTTQYADANAEAHIGIDVDVVTIGSGVAVDASSVVDATYGMSLVPVRSSAANISLSGEYAATSMSARPVATTTTSEITYAATSMSARPVATTTTSEITYAANVTAIRAVQAPLALAATYTANVAGVRAVGANSTATATLSAATAQGLSATANTTATVTLSATASAVTFARQRMNKSGLHAATSGTTFYQVNSFVADGTYPGDVSGGNSMLISGSGACTVTAHCVRKNTTGNVVFQLRRNGNAIGGNLTVSGTTSGDITWSGTLADGDYLDLWQYRNYTAGSSSGCTDGTYIDVNPA